MAEDLRLKQKMVELLDQGQELAQKVAVKNNHLNYSQSLDEVGWVQDYLMTKVPELDKVMNYLCLNDAEGCAVVEDMAGKASNWKVDLDLKNQMADKLNKDQVADMDWMYLYLALVDNSNKDQVADKADSWQNWNMDLSLEVDKNWMQRVDSLNMDQVEDKKSLNVVDKVQEDKENQNLCNQIVVANNQAACFVDIQSFGCQDNWKVDSLKVVDKVNKKGLDSHQDFATSSLVSFQLWELFVFSVLALQVYLANQNLLSQVVVL